MGTDSTSLFTLTYTVEGDDSGTQHTLQIPALHEKQALGKANTWLKEHPRCTYLSLEHQTDEPPSDKPAHPDVKEVVEQPKADVEPKMTVYLYIMYIEDPFGTTTPHPVYAPDNESAWARANTFYDKTRSINQKYRKVERSTAAFTIGNFTYQAEMEMLVSIWKSMNKQEGR